ncbi:hypothetical protein Goshw_030312 [Gossypium schwendimanii]|uniref:Ycf2 N-terminal domain-containing protein n=1 Tax=Gossypium schwendimanii TaxID=34291 RepID=A0A7J9L6X4_GOSSC|nr:hypothetical protein [Gossypium schwendimanii]
MEIEPDRFPKCLPGYSSMSRLSMECEKWMNNHMLPEEIEEFLGNPTRSIRFFSLIDGQNFIWVRTLLRDLLEIKNC